MKKQEEKKQYSGQWCVVLFFGLIGAVCGWTIMSYIDLEGGNHSLMKDLGSVFVLIIVMYLLILVQMIIHEAGHLVFGLASGYRFSSFRIMNLMWIKKFESSFQTTDTSSIWGERTKWERMEGTKERILFKRFSLTGTGGQCLMAPPDFKNGNIPVVLYNLGGVLLNIITAVICLGIYFAIPDGSYLSIIMLLSFIIGIGIALMNGIPMRLGMINNDGYNAYELRRKREACQAFWLQMKVNEQITKDIRLKDMPEEWFVMPSDDKMHDSMIAVVGVLVCNRLMDEQKFEEAETRMQHLLEMKSGIVGIHRALLICDCMYCALIAGRKEEAEKMLTKEQKKFMKSMKKNPSILRTEYTYELLGQSNVSKADSIKTVFETCAKTYPYLGEISAERELMCIADRQMPV